MKAIKPIGVFLLALLVTCHLSLVTAVQAAVPWVINYQGRLTDSTGTPITGSYTITFRLYDDATAGTKQWQEKQTISLTTTDNGIFNVVLGAVTSLSAVDFNAPMWLSIQVADDTEMTPRQRLTSVGYAMNADEIDGLDSAKFMRTDVDTSTSGKLTITRAGTALVITPSSNPAANTKLIDVQNAAGTSKFSVDLEGDVAVAGDLSVTGTIAGSTTITGTTNASWDIGSGTDATANNLSLLFGQTSGQKSIVFKGASTSDFTFSDPIRLGTQSALRFEGATAGGNYVAMKAPSSISSNVTWTLPSADGSANQVLITNGSGTLSWATASSLSGVGTITGVTAGTGLTGGGTSGTVTLSLSTPVSVANGGTGASTLTSNGVLLGNGTSAISATTAGSANQVLRVPAAGGAPAFGAIDVSSSSAVTGALGATNGGTSQSTYTTGDTLYASAANTLSKLTIGSSGQFLKVSSGVPAWATLSTSDVSGLGTMATQNANNVAITGGAIDGTTIGATTAAAGTFTNLTTTGTTTLGNGTGDVTIKTKTYVQNPAAGALFIAQDPAAANSDGYIALGRRSAKTGGWNILQGRSSDGKLVWNGSAIEVAGDSPASLTFGNSTSKVSLTYDPSNDMISFSKGTFSQQFRNLVKNGSFEAFSALETFNASTAPGGTGGAGSTFLGGWQNFAPDEWLWDAGKVYQNAPVLFTPSTTVTATNLQQDFVHGKSSVTIEDTNTAATNGLYNATTDASATLYTGSITDGHIEQTITSLKPSTMYAVGAYMRRLSGTVECIVDLTGEAGEGGTPSTTLGATLTANDTKLTVANQTDYNSFPNNGILLITANGNTERISYTGKEVNGAAYQLTSLIRQFDGSPSAGDGSGNVASGTAVKLAPFQHLTTGVGAANNFTLYKGQFVTKPTADDVKMHLIATGTTAGDQCRFDAVQVVEGRSIPEFQPSAIVDTGDQTVYGALRMGRTSDGRGGVLAVDKAIRTRAVEFFGKDPGLSGTTGGFGGVGPSTKIASGSGSTITMTTSGTYFGANPRDMLVSITAVSPQTFQWQYRECLPSTGCTGAYQTGGTGLAIGSYTSATEVPSSFGVKLAFANTSTVTTSDQWQFYVSGMNMAQQYNSYSGTTTYQPGQTRIYQDPVSSQLTFQDGTTVATLSQIVGAGVASPARVDPPTFFPASTGGGQMTLSTSQGYTGSAQITFDVQICADGSGATRDSYQWRDNILNGSNTAASDWDITCTQIPASGGPTAALPIPGGGGSTYGFTLTFGSPAGTWQDGNLNDRWQVKAYPAVTSATVKTSDVGTVTSTMIANGAVTGPKIAMGSDAKGDVLVHNGTNYVRLPVGSNGLGIIADSTTATGVKWSAVGTGNGTVTSITAGTGLTGGTITTSGTIAVDVGTTANKIVQLNASAQLPAVDGSLVTSLNASNLASGTVADARLSSNVPLKNAANSFTAAQTLAPTSDAVPLTLKRGTDTTPLANLLTVTNAAGATTLFAIDPTGKITTGSADAALLTSGTLANARLAGPLVSSVTAGTGVTVTNPGAVGAATVNVDVGTTANKIVQLNASAQLPAVDGSLVTSLNAANISSGTLAIARGGTNNTTYTTSKFLAYDGTKLASTIYDNTSFLTAEADTLATVASRGAATTTQLGLNGGLTSAQTLTSNNSSQLSATPTANLAATGTINALTVTPTESGTAAANTYTINALNLAAVAGTCPVGATCVENALFIPASAGYEDILKVGTTSVINGSGQHNLASVTGTLGVANGGTNLTAATDDNVMVGNGTTWQAKTLPTCADASGNHLNYDAVTNTFSCGTSSSTANLAFSALTNGTNVAAAMVVGSGASLAATGTGTIAATTAAALAANGANCTNQFPRGVDAAGTAEGCASVAGTDFASQAANIVLAGPSSGVAASPTFRALVAADIPTLDWTKIDTTTNKVSLTSAVTGTLPVANGGTGTTTSTGSGSVVLSTSPTLTTPSLGVATATSINKVAMTAPATSATLTIADGKTLTANNSLTLAGTDGTTMTFPASSDTVVTLAATQTLSNKTLANPVITGDVLAHTGSYLSPYGGIGRYENALKYSEDLTQTSAWTRTGLDATTPVALNVTAPNGVANGAVTMKNGAAANGTLAQTVTTTVTLPYTFAVWAKAGTSTTAQVELTTNGAGATTDTAALTLTSSWQRFSVTKSAGGGTSPTTVTATLKDTGAAATTILLWGAQLEQSATPGVYVRTTTAAIAASQGAVTDGTPTGSGSGSVTSVGLAAPVEFTVSGSPVTGAGTLTLAKATQSANLLYAGPASGAAAAPSFRALVAADIPTLDWTKIDTTTNKVALGTQVSGTLPAASFPALTGDVTTTAGALATTLATSGVTAGTYTKLTVDAKGRATLGATATLASADFANQGTTTSLLHGNAAGNPTWAQASLTADVTGLLPIANGGTNNSAAYTAGSVVFSNGTSLTQNNANLFWDNTNNRLGLGTTSPGSVGVAKLELNGANTSAAGPHIQAVTGADTYPLFQSLNWAHNNVSSNFDAYFDGLGGWRSAYSGSNFQIYKVNDTLQFNYDSGKAQGALLSWKRGIVMDASGNVGLGIPSLTPQATLDVRGDILTPTGSVLSPYGGIGRYENALKYSEDLTQTSAWTRTGLDATTPVALNVTAPNGVANGAVTMKNGAAANGTLAQTVTTTVTLPYTFAVWAKAGTSTTAQVELTTNGAGATTDTAALTLTSSWQRFSVTKSTGGGTSPTTVTATLKDTGAAATTILLWGAQLEQNATPGVYVRTTTTAVAASQGAVTDGSPTSTSTPAFSSLTTGTNTSATMTLGTGSSLTYSGSGTVNANQFKGNSTVALTDGGTNASLTASNGGILYSTASAGAILAGTATANKVLMSGASAAPVWSTPTYPNASATAGKYLKSDGTNFIASTSSAAGTGSCTNQFVSAENADAAPTCTTAILASAQFASQGTTTQVLHGNAAGNPSWGAVSLTTDVTGMLPAANLNQGANYTWTGQQDFTGATLLGASPLRFEGATVNSIYTTLAITDPTTTSKTITFPDLTGTAALIFTTTTPLASSGIMPPSYFASDYNMGYRFRPTTNGVITALGGRWDTGARTVRLYSCPDPAGAPPCGSGVDISGGGVSVTSTGTFAYTNLGHPISVTAGTSYVVAVRSGAGNYGSVSFTMPVTTGGITIDSSQYDFATNTVPTTSVTAAMYGQADVKFEPSNTNDLTVAGNVTAAGQIAATGLNPFSGRSGASGSYATIALGRTSTESQWAVAAAAGSFATDSAAGDVILREEDSTKALRLLSGTGASALIINSTSPQVTIGGDFKATGTITAGSGANQITTAAGLLDATKLTGAVPTASLNNAVQLQGSTPGTQQTGNLNVSGAGIFGGNLTASGTITAGSNAASTGTIRLPNAAQVVYRNGANTGDISILTMDSSNVVTLGSASAGNTVITSGGGGGGVKIATNLMFGSAPAADYAGAIRLSNNQAIASINAAGSQNIQLIGVDASNQLSIGNAFASKVILTGGGEFTPTTFALGASNTVGVGTSTPQATLDVRGAVLSTNVVTPFGGVGRYQNLLLHSEDMSAWAQSGGTVTVNVDFAAANPAPNGTTTADRLSQGSSTANTSIYEGSALGSAAGGRTFTFSVWLKAASAHVARIFMNTAANWSSIQSVSVTTSWQRFNVTWTVPGGDTNTTMSAFVSLDDGVTYTGSLDVWGAQLEEATTPGVYVSTTTSAVAASRGVVANTDGLVGGNLTVSGTLTAGSGSNVITTAAGLLDATKLSGTVPVANGGTNNSVAYTAGSVLFSDGTKLTQNNAQLFWDNTNNRLGIGTTSPGQALEVNGGMRLNTATAKPACSASVRGTFWVTQGAAGVKDNVEVCAKDAADAYAWRTVY